MEHDRGELGNGRIGRLRPGDCRWFSRRFARSNDSKNRRRNHSRRRGSGSLLGRHRPDQRLATRRRHLDDFRWHLRRGGFWCCRRSNWKTQREKLKHSFENVRRFTALVAVCRKTSLTSNLELMSRLWSQLADSQAHQRKVFYHPFPGQRLSRLIVGISPLFS